MPSAIYRGSPALKVELDNVGLVHHPPCHPGDVLTGRVTRSLPGVSPRATIAVRLLGRAKTKITVTRNHGESTRVAHYRNRYNFFDATQTRQVIHDGPLHIAGREAGVLLGEPQWWPFAIEVPLHPSPAAIHSEGVSPENCYLSLQPEDIASEPLPGSFHDSGRHFNTEYETFVEYHLEAEFWDSGSHGRFVTAVMPVQMRARRTMEYPLEGGVDLQQHVAARSVSSYHLTPGMEHAQLTFKQKTKQFMGSSKVPTFGFSLQVMSPTVIQLGNPTPIPLTMRVIPIKARTSAELREVDQTVLLTSLEVVLKAHTSTIAPTTFNTKQAEGTTKHHISLPVVALGKVINRPAAHNPVAEENGESSSSSATAAAVEEPKDPFGAILPSDWDEGKGTALDIGTALDFRLFESHASALGLPIAKMTDGLFIYPAFVTYCIRHSMTLKWKADVVVAGKREKFEAEHAVTILGPSQWPPVATALPPEKSEHLPSNGEINPGGPSGSARMAETAEEALPVYTK